MTSLALQPATSDQFAAELTSCLALVVPVGMSEEARREWLAVAWATLKHLPPDLLSVACQEARKSCDHPSKIVPAITAYAEPRLRDRKWMEREFPSTPALPAPSKKSPYDRRGEPMSAEDTEALNLYLKSAGSCFRYKESGERYKVREQEPIEVGLPPRRNPTRQDYIDMGVDPAVLDKIEAEKAADTHEGA